MEQAVHSEKSLQKSATLPRFIQEVFRCVDAKDFEGLHEFLTRMIGETAALSDIVHEVYLSGEAR